MTYNDFQRKRTVWREKELKERQEDIASPRPPLNNSITDQALRELFERVEKLEPKPTVVELPYIPRSTK